MEKYLNSNFAEADEQSIKELQNYLNKLGYKNSSGKKLEVTGTFDDETQKALEQAKKDFEIKKAIGGKYRVMTGIELSNLQRKSNDFFSSEEEKANGVSYTEILKIRDKTVIIPKETNKNIGNKDLRDYLFDKGLNTDIRYYANNTYTVLKSKLEGLSVKSNVTQENEFTVSYGISSTDRNFAHFTQSLAPVLYSDDPQLKRIEKFDNFRTPNPPKMKVVEVTDPEPQKPEIPAEVKTTTPQATDVKEPEKPKEKTTKVEIIDNRKISEPSKIPSASKTPEAPKKQGCLSEEEWNGFCKMVEKMGRLDATEQKQINDRISEINRQYETAQIGKINYSEQGEPTMEYYRHTCFQEGKSSIKAPFERT